VSDLQLDEALLDEIAANLDLRRPNRDATESVVAEISQHFDVEGNTGTFTGIVDAATAVGKTYTMAATIDYLAQARGWVDFVIVTPGRIVRDKTIENFTLGNERSLVNRLGSNVQVITAENFDTLAAAAVMDDPGVVKVYVLTVQALMAPPRSGTVGITRKNVTKKTRAYQESFGAAFYDRLASIEELVILADEFHTYETGRVFSAAIDELNAKVVVGLTATPRRQDDERIVYRYPLAAAIAEGYVKLPVVLGRADDRNDRKVQLLDGLRVVEAKRAVAQAHSERLGRRVNPILLVIARDIAEAQDIEAEITDRNFAGGRYEDAVIRVDSSVADSDDDWEHLKNVEDPDSHVRVIVSVGMLKEGWDVKNVYAILATRALASTLLTEQTLGRGLRLPYGKRTGIQLLDSLDVLAHEKYDQLLARAGVTLKEEFVSYRTRATSRRNAAGALEIHREKEEVKPVVSAGDQTLAVEADGSLTPQETAEIARNSAATEATPDASGTEGVTPSSTAHDPLDPAFVFAKTDERLQQAAKAEADRPRTLTMRADVAQSLSLPVLSFTAQVAEFTLTAITDRSAFRELGRKIASDPQKYLRRTVVATRMTRDLEGNITQSVVTQAAEDRIEAYQETITSEQAIVRLVNAIMTSDIVSSRRDLAKQERAAAREIVEEFIDGLNGKADTVLSSYLDRSKARLISLLAQERAALRTKPTYKAQIGFRSPTTTRTLSRVVSEDLTTQLPYAEFRRTAFTGWAKSAFGTDWFDSHPERRAALIADGAQEVQWWLRLLDGDLPIRVDDGKRTYHPDFIVRDSARLWVVEVKSDRDAETETVTEKRDAARLWVNVVNANRPEGSSRWGYLFATEQDISQARGDWAALVSLTGAA
jgi:type III restriction enzyme